MINVSPLAGKPAPASMLVNVPRLVTAYYAEHPDPSVAAERVAFGTGLLAALRLDGSDLSESSWTDVAAQPPIFVDRCAGLAEALEAGGDSTAALRRYLAMLEGISADVLRRST